MNFNKRETTCHSIEAAMFYAMQKKLFPTKKDFSKLGGWVQTSSFLLPLVAMQAEEARRQLWNVCFDCGGRHYSKASAKRDCEGDNNTCAYTCGVCEAKITINSRGGFTSIASPDATPPVPPAASISATMPKTRPAPAAFAQPARRSSPELDVPAAPAKRQRTDGGLSRPSLFVHIAGAKYQTLPWFLGSVPTKNDKQIAEGHGRRGLVELRNGDHNTLMRYDGKAILHQDAFPQFRSHRWVNTYASRRDMIVVICR